MRAIPCKFSNASSRLAKTGPYFGFAVACFLIALMVIFQITDLVVAIVRAW